MAAIIAGMRVVGGAGVGVQVERRAGVRGAAAVGPRGEAPTEPPDCHETNLKCLMNKFCHETRHDL